MSENFSVPQTEYPLGGSNKKVVIILHVDSCHGTTIVMSEQHLYQTIVLFHKTIVLPRKLATGSIHATAHYWVFYLRY